MVFRDKSLKSRGIFPERLDKETLDFVDFLFEEVPECFLEMGDGCGCVGGGLLLLGFDLSEEFFEAAVVEVIWRPIAYFSHF